MRVQKITNMSMIKPNYGQQGLTECSVNCKPKPRVGQYNRDFGMPSFKAKTNIKQAKTLIGELQSLMSESLKSIKKSFDKSEIKQKIFTPIEKKWSDFAYKAPKLSQALKGAMVASGLFISADVVKEKIS